MKFVLSFVLLVCTLSFAVPARGQIYIIGPELQGVYRIIQAYNAKKLSGPATSYELTKKECAEKVLLARIEGRHICLVDCVKGWFEASNIKYINDTTIAFTLNWNGFERFVLGYSAKGTVLLIGLRPDKSILVIELVKIMDINAEY